MEVIIIEDTVYKVSRKEYLKLTAMQEKIKDAKDHHEVLKCEDELMEYVDESKIKYNLIGPIMLDCRR